MGNRIKQIKSPFLLSLLLHLALLSLLLVSFSPAHYRLPGVVDPRSVIQVQAVSEAKWAEQVKAREAKIKARRQAQLHRKQARLKAQRMARIERAQAKRREMIKAKHLATLRLQQKALLLKENQKLLDQQQRKIASTHQALLKKMMAQTAQREAQRLQQVKARQQQGIVNQYIPKILAAIGQQWMLPLGISNKLRCIYQINLAPGGVVIGVKLLSSSGNIALDRTGQQAIWRASPLPVPQNPELFDKFRQLRLTMRPEEALSG